MDDAERKQTENATYVKALAIAYFVMGAIAMVLGLIPLVHVVVGLVMVGGVSPELFRESGMAQIAVGIYLIFALMAMVLMETMAILKLATGYFMWTRQYRVFCMCVAGITCLNIPIGTAVGALTFVVLTRADIVREFP